jgi:SAM-dependent methyltransferase
LPGSGKPGETFGRVAEAYARTRPRYPRPAIQRAIKELELTYESIVLDLAAGTGNLTRSLREHFARVIAVEPDAGMRAQFEGEVLVGTAEAIPLQDRSVDAVFVGEAFHWFEYGRALAEARRVACNGLAIFNRSWGIKEQPELLPQPFADDLDRVWQRFHGDRTQSELADWMDVVLPDGSERFVEMVPISGRDLVDLHLTGSTPASIPDVDRAAIAERAYPLMEPEYEMRVVTELHWKRFTSGKGSDT